MSLALWRLCLARLHDDLSSTEFSMWIRPLHAEFNDKTLFLYAPNKFVLDWIKDKYIVIINELLHEFSDTKTPLLRLKVSTSPILSAVNIQQVTDNTVNLFSSLKKSIFSQKLINKSNHLLFPTKITYRSNINNNQNFDNFIEGKSNQLAREVALQVAYNPGNAYNPLFIYGSTGIGKTHLLNAIGNIIIECQPNTKIIYIHSEQFVQDMVQAIQNNTVEAFKIYYRSVDILLIDDIQFFANKERTQEEFMHTLNFLLEKNKQIVLTSDRYPKKIIGLEERLKSRFSWGLTVLIESPELETRATILIKKANKNHINLPIEVSFFIAERLNYNMRELEGALNRVIVNAKFARQAITIDFVRESLRDLLTLQEKIVTIDNIQKNVAEYYKIKVVDLLSKRRLRSITRPRQIAMAISKKLTNHSLPEIGNAFGGRDHTTVLYACRKIEQLCKESQDIKEDFSNLLQILSAII